MLVYYQSFSSLFPVSVTGRDKNIPVTSFAKRPEKSSCIFACYIFNVKVSVNNILFQVFGRCWSAFLYVDNIRQNRHVGNVNTTVWFFAKWLYVLSDS